ncbi:hypothetical protein Lser_V15G04453 [Lactuca serriola]
MLLTTSKVTVSNEWDYVSTHLCFLPTQLFIYIWYIVLSVVTLVVVLLWPTNGLNIQLHIEICLATISVALFLQVMVSFVLEFWNRINGSIPEALGDMSTLEELVVEDNFLGGPLPQNLGRLSRLRRFLASANNFTGSITDSYGNLTNLEDLEDRWDYIIWENTRFYRKLEKSHKTGYARNEHVWTYSFYNIFVDKLEFIRISDLTRSSSTPFPNLEAMINMEDCEYGNRAAIFTTSGVAARKFQTNIESGHFRYHFSYLRGRRHHLLVNLTSMIKTMLTKNITNC